MGLLRRSPKGPNTQYLRTLVPNTTKSMAFGTRVLKYWVLGPSGESIALGSCNQFGAPRTYILPTTGPEAIKWDLPKGSKVVSFWVVYYNP